MSALFCRTLSFLGLVSAALGLGAIADAEAATETARAPRAAVFRSAGFPTVDAPAIDDPTLALALDGVPLDVLDSPSALASKLSRADHDVLVLTYGSAFPVEAWPAIRDFVRAGGGLVVLGGAPFHQPVRRSGDASYVVATRQPTYARELLIGPAQELELTAFAAPRTTAAVEGSGWNAALPEPARAWALTVRLTSVKDMPGEDGSAGPRDGVVRPLVHVADASGLPRACPLVEIDRLRGPGAGGRWLLAPSDARLSAEAIREAVRRALAGAVEVDARPIRAAVEPGEPVRLRVSVSRPGARAGESPASSARVSVRDDGGRQVAQAVVELAGSAELRAGTAVVTASPALPPGLYHATVAVADGPAGGRVVETGFWVSDRALLASGPRLSVSRDWLRRDGRVMPVVGTTYMASDVHRKFLFEPNPHAWDRDFAAMARQGVNMVRTGLWTGWSRAMLDPGAVDDDVLAALDAYVLSAAKNGILVAFNFFAFLPPAFGDANPYLGPRALEGQRAFLTHVASRYRGVSWIHWDLINEPSYAPPEGLWSNQPIRDRHEREAWLRWVRARHGDDEALLRDLWRDPGPDLFELPRPIELRHSFLREDRRPRKARDFGEFSQWAVARWAATLRDVLKAAGGDVLVTLGQDEGGTADRPAQSFHYDSLDYTAVHTWWNNDDLLWDGVVTKSPELPHLHQETGLMSLHDKDGFAWRTPEAAARLLERKFAYAFAGRGTGVVQWAWNINPYMPVENEATIGFFRPDGTAKPELRVLGELAAFVREAAPHLDDFAPDPVVLVFPHSRVFMGRPGGADATKRVVRLLAERFGVVPTALSEVRLSPERLRDARLVLVPAPEILEEEAAAALLAATKAGAKVLVTGAVEGDSYGRTTPSLAALGIVDAGRPLALHEPTPWATAGLATFGGLAQERMRRGAGASPSTFAGGLWHEPLPLEFAQESEPLLALLRGALKAAGVVTHPDRGGVAARLLVAPKAVLAVVVNETPLAARRVVGVEGRSVAIPVGPLGARLALFERGSGRLLASTSGEAIVRQP